MSSQPELTTQLVKHPRAPARASKRRDRAARSVTGVALRCWWAAFAVLAAFVVWAALWSSGVARIDRSTEEALDWIWFIDSLCLMVLSVIVAVMLGEKRTRSQTHAADDDVTAAHLPSRAAVLVGELWPRGGLDHRATCVEPPRPALRRLAW